MNFKKEIMKLLKILTIGTIITFSWIGLEIILDGQVMPSQADSIITLVLTYSIYSNIENYNKKR